jgi:hypothetical protein
MRRALMAIPSILALLALPAGAFAKPAAPAKPAAAPAKTDAAKPMAKLGWRPAEKVRSTGEVFLHVAAGNYYIPTMWGAKPPKGIQFDKIENSAGKDKDQIIAELKASYDHLRNVINAVPDADMDRKIDVFGKPGTVRSLFMVLASHSHEHLGQSIAYARSNGIVPPWSK